MSGRKPNSDQSELVDERKWSVFTTKKNAHFHVRNQTLLFSVILYIVPYQNGALTIVRNYTYDNVGRLISINSENLTATPPVAS